MSFYGFLRLISGAKKIFIWSVLLLSVGTISCKTLPSNAELSDTGASRNEYVGAQFLLRDTIKRIIGEMQIAQSGVQDGARVMTITRISAGGFRPDNNGVSVDVTVDLSVDATKSKYIALGASGWGNVSFWGQAVITLQLGLRNDTIEPSLKSIYWSQPLQHHVNYVGTNARIARGAVLKGARKQAEGTAPETKVKIRESFRNTVVQGLADQKGKLRGTLRDVALTLQSVPNTRPRLRSTQNAAYLEFMVPSNGQSLTSKVIPSGQHSEAGIRVHESIFAHLLTPNLAGKELTMPELQQAICKSFTNFYYRFCSIEPVNDPVEVRIKFPEENPVRFSFDGNQIQLILNGAVSTRADVNAVLAAAKGEQPSSEPVQTAEYTEPSTEPSQSDGPGTSINTNEENNIEVTHETPQMNIILTYERENRRYLRKDTAVAVVPTGVSDQRFVNSSAYASSLQVMAKLGIEAAAPKEIPIPAAPAYLAKDPRVQRHGGSFVIMTPSDVGTEQGWIYSYFSYCDKQNTQVAMGISMKPITIAGGQQGLKISAVHNDTPAKVAKALKATDGFSQADENFFASFKPETGLKVGDVLYEVDGQKRPLEDPQFFSAYVAGRSLIPQGNVIKLFVGRKVPFQDPETGQQHDIWVRIDYEAELRKVCKSSQ